MRIRDPGWRQFGSGIRDGKKSDPGSGINIPDPPHWLKEGTCRRALVPEELIPDVQHFLLEPDVGGLFAAEEAAPPEARVVERLQEVTALQDTGDDATP